MSGRRFASTDTPPARTYRRKVSGAAVVLFVLLAAQACSGQDFSGPVLSVDDGDSVRVARAGGDVRIRIFGIDAPEADQAYGAEARDVARRLLLNRTVRVSARDVDQYGRLVAELRIDDRDVGADLISAGAAWNYAQFSQSARYAELEAAARRNQRGLWARPAPTPPWQFRASSRTGEQASTPITASGPMHGNVRSRVFHAPGCENYTCENCTAVFPSSDEAVAAGFRPHAVCVR